VLSLALDPENLGSVRIVAHISADQVRIDLAGATDAAKSALRSTLDDLRRDLQSAGLSAELGLADDRPAPDGDQRRPGSGPTGEPLAPGAADTTADRPVPDDSVHGLDLVL
jgi:flagellar hook-length control protein FliK